MDLEEEEVNPRTHLQAERIFAFNDTGKADWPKSWSVDLTITEYNRDVFDDGLPATLAVTFDDVYPFPTALMKVDYTQVGFVFVGITTGGFCGLHAGGFCFTTGTNLQNIALWPLRTILFNTTQMITSGIGVEYWFSMLSLGTTHLLMQNTLMKYGFIRNSTSQPGTGQVMNPKTDQCVIGAMFAKPICWTHAHESPRLKYWSDVPERRVECALNMPGLSTLIYDVMYLCRYCTMEITASGGVNGGPHANATCVVTEREKCTQRKADFYVQPPLE